MARRWSRIWLPVSILSIVFTAGHALADADADGILDTIDNCPLEPNSGQSDLGSLGGGADGIGDACQCGDVTDEGDVGPADLTAIREGLAETGMQLMMPRKCNVSGPVDALDADGNGLRDDCSVVDATILARAIAMAAPGIAQDCEPARSAPLIPGSISIISPLPGAILGETPVQVILGYQGSVRFDTLAMSLQGGPGPSDVSDLFLQSGGRLVASLSLVDPALYTLTIDAEDQLGAVLQQQVTFDLPPFQDLAVVGATLYPDPDLPEQGVPFVVHYTVENRGTLASPGVMAQVSFTPGPPPPGPAAAIATANGPMSLPPDAIGPLEPGETAGVDSLFPAGITEVGNISVDVDTAEQLSEINELNNAGIRFIFPTPPVYTDLDVRVENFRTIGLSQIEFTVRLTNVGNQVIDVPRLRYAVRSLIDDPNEPGNPDVATLGNYQSSIGGEVGPCKDFSDPNGSLTFINQPLAVGESRLIFESAFWNPHNTPAGMTDGATGFYRLCVEAIAKAPAPGNVIWLPAITELHADGAPGADNNFSEISWDVRDIPAYPTDGNLVLAGVTMNGDLAGTSTSFNLTLKNLDSPDKFGEADVVLSWRARGGRDGDDPDNSLEATGAPVRVSLLAPRTLIPGIPLPAPAGGSGVLPYAHDLELTVKVLSTDSNVTLPLLEEGRVLPLNYRDLELVEIVTNPANPYIRPVPSNGVPVTVFGVVRNWGATEETVSVTVQQPPGTGLTLAPTAISSSITIPAGSQASVPYLWSPPLASSETGVGPYTISAGFPMPGNESAGLPVDHLLMQDFTVNVPPVIYAVDVIPNFDPATYNFMPSDVNADPPVIDYGTTTPLGIVFYGRVDEGETIQAPVVVETLLGGTTILSTSIEFTQTGYGYLLVDWNPPRAGFHTVRVKVNAQVEVERRIDVAPIITALATGFNSLSIASDGDTDYNSAGEFLRLHARADPAVLLDTEDATVAGARLSSFSVDGGNDNFGFHLVEIEVEFDYAGVVQVGGLTIGDSDYEAIVGVGIKPRAGNISDSIGHFNCYDVEDPNCVIWYETVWQATEGDDFDLGFASGDTLELANAGLKALASRLFGPAVAGPLGAFFFVEEQIVETVTCDEQTHSRRRVVFRLPLRSGDYDAYIIMAGAVETKNGVGNPYSYTDFYDAYSSDCGGTRDGIKITFLGGSMYSPSSCYFQFGNPNGCD